MAQGSEERIDTRARTEKGIFLLIARIQKIRTKEKRKKRKQQK
jgi:hypothetical protein